MRRNSGFTLIELVVVIVLLGILSATAAAKYMDLQRDARVSMMKGLVGAMKSADQLAHSKAIIKGLDKKTNSHFCMDGAEPCVRFSANAIELVKGHPATTGGIQNLLQDKMEPYTNSNQESDFVYHRLSSTKLAIYPSSVHRSGKFSEKCRILYEMGTDMDAPTYDVVLTDC